MTIGTARFRSLRASPGMSHRLALAVGLTVLLAGAAGSAGGEEGAMATAPLPPPLPAAPPTTGLQQPQGGRSSASRPVVPQSHPRAEGGTRVAHLHKPTRGQKHHGQRAVGNVDRREADAVPPVASAVTPPPPPLPFPYGYFPGAPPPYGSALLYLPPGPPGWRNAW